MKRVLSLMLTFALLLTLMPLGLFDLRVNAATEGYYTYSVSNGEATITDCDTSISGAVTIPSALGGYPVTTIGKSAFEDCSSLTGVTIPDSVTTIGKSAFYGCSSLTAVYITNLAVWCSIDFGNNFANPLHYGKNLYLNGTLVENLAIPDSVTSIGDSAFSGCSLQSVTIPNSVTSIGIAAFSGCSSLTAVYITDLAAWCSIEFGEPSANPLYYGKNLYLNGTLVENLVIPDSVTSIGIAAFSSCSLESVSIPDSVTSIGSSAFSHCSNLQSVTIPDSVTSIGNSAFQYCSGLESVTIPNSVTSIGISAFSGCSSLQSMTIPDSVTSIGSSAFYNCSSLKSVTIPNSVTSIGSAAFSGCSLESVSIPDSVTSIGSSAFSRCSSLQSVTIPDSVTSIGDYAFSRCSSLQSVTIGNSVTSINFHAFYDCGSLWHVHFLGDMPTVGSSAFSACASNLKLCYLEGTTGWENCSYTTEIWDHTRSTDCTNITYTCNICGGIYSYPCEDAHAWDTGEVTAAPACTEDGTKTYTCADCGKTKEELIPATGHDTVSVNGLAPDCSTPGFTESSYCSSCGEVFIAQEEIPELGHDISYVGSKAPTCTETGSRSHYACARCKKYYTDPECQFEMPASYAAIAALGHSEVIDAAVAATCTSTGLTEGSHCDRCGEVLIARKETPAAHSLIYVEERAATCTEAGNQAHYACKFCGNCFFDEEGQFAAPDSYVIVNALDHSFTDGICSCGATESTEPTLDEGITIAEQLYLESDLTMQFRIKSELLRAYDISTAYLVVERDLYFTDGSESVDVQTLTEYTISNNRLVFVYSGIAAAQMNDEIRVVLHIKDAAGKEYVSAQKVTSVTTYAKGILELMPTGYDKLYTVLMDMLNYGTAAQNHFNRHTNAPANEAYEIFANYASYASLDLTSPLTDDASEIANEGAGGKINQALDLGTRIGIIYKATLPDGVAAEDATLVITTEDGTELESIQLASGTVDSGGRYVVNFYGSASREMRRIVHATVYANGSAVSNTYTYSICSYAHLAANTEGIGESLLNLTKLMIIYGDSAAAYFG